MLLVQVLTIYTNYYTASNEGIKRIVGLTKLRFARFENEQISAQELLKVFEEEFNIVTYYNPEEGSIVWQHRGSRTAKFVFFKNFTEKHVPDLKKLLKMPEISRVVQNKRLSESKAIALLFGKLYSDYLNEKWCTLEEFKQNGYIEIRNNEGEIIEVFNSLDDYNDYIERHELLKEYEKLFEDSD